MDKRRHVVYVKQADDDGHYEAVISTRDADRDGDIIEPDGWELENYRKNPVVLFAHDPRLVVGGTDDIRATNDGLVAKFHFNLQTQLGRELNALYAAGDMRAFSVGFMPLEYEEIREDGRVKGYRFTRQELYEFSAVAIPANPNALVRMEKAAAAIPPNEGGWEFIEALKKHAGVVRDAMEHESDIARRVAALEERVSALAKLVHEAPAEPEARTDDADYYAGLAIVASAALARSKGAGR